MQKQIERLALKLAGISKWPRIAIMSSLSIILGYVVFGVIWHLVEVSVDDSAQQITHTLLGGFIFFIFFMMLAVIAKLSIRDSLTGVFNLRFFLEDAPRMVTRASRHDEEVCVIFIDINDFGNINDIYGHKTGDDALKKIAETISGFIRSYDLFFRKGGDEFVIIITTNDVEQASAINTRIRSEISIDNPLYIRRHGENIPISVSTGFAHEPALGEDPMSQLEWLLDKADKDMYLQKALEKSVRT